MNERKKKKNTKTFHFHFHFHSFTILSVIWSNPSGFLCPQFIHQKLVSGEWTEVTTKRHIALPLCMVGALQHWKKGKNRQIRTFSGRAGRHCAGCNNRRRGILVLVDNWWCLQFMGGMTVCVTSWHLVGLGSCLLRISVGGWVGIPPSPLFLHLTYSPVWLCSSLSLFSP